MPHVWNGFHRLCVCLIVLLLVSPACAESRASTAPDDSQNADPTTAAGMIALVKAECHYDAKETKPKKIRKADKCILDTLLIYRENLVIQQTLAAQAASLTNTQPPSNTSNPPSPPSPPPPSPPPAKSKDLIGTVGQTPQAGTNVPSSSPGLNPFYGSSLSTTPSTCDANSGLGLPGTIRVHRLILAPNDAEDDFGHRLGRRFVVFQVSVENGNTQYQFALQDVGVDFSRQFGAPQGTPSYVFRASGQDLSLLRGIPEKGQDLDPRNLTLHVLQGIGSVAGAVSGLTTFSDVMGSAVAVFNGSFLQAFTSIAPDHTANQLNRLSDSAFTAGTPIDKHGVKIVAIFVPIDSVLSNAQQSIFRKEPYLYLNLAGFGGTLNDADICVDGSFIQTVPPAVTLTLTSAVFNDTNPPATANKQVPVQIIGAGLVAGDTELILGSNGNTTSTTISSTDGKTASVLINLPPNYANGTAVPAMLQSTANSSINSGTSGVLTVKPAQ